VSRMYLVPGPGDRWRNFDWSGEHTRGARFRSYREARKMQQPESKEAIRYDHEPARAPEGRLAS